MAVFSRVVATTTLLLVLAGCTPPPVNRTATTPLTTVNSVDLDRYLGRWYEIARYENSFERDCWAVTATYARKPDGSISVLNACRKGSLTGPEDIAEGSATIVDTTTQAKLAVTFFWPFTGDYWIIGLADDYSWAIVGEPSGRYLWVLARSPQLPPEAKATVLSRLAAFGYRTSELHWTPQPAS